MYHGGSAEIHEMNNNKLAPRNTSKAGTARDQLDRLTDELARAQRELLEKDLDTQRQKAEKFQEIGMVVHGLRNPAAAMLTATEWLVEDEGLRPGHRLLLHQLIESNAFMLHMIDNILDICGIECGKLNIDPQPTDLVSLVNENLLLNERQAKRRGIRLEISSETPALLVNLDPVKIMQVVDNLLSNAIKFCYENSTIRVSLGVRQKIASISVRDEGPGIAPDEIDTIFEPFQKCVHRNRSAKKGVGLGLAISKRIVEGHGGTIEVTSDLGVGSTFTVSLPMTVGGKSRPPKRLGQLRSKAATA